MNGAMPLLIVDQAAKTFRDSRRPLPVLQPLSLQLATGEFVCLLGPSGSGKSTLLRIIGGLVKPDSGSLWFDGKPLTVEKVDVVFFQPWFDR